MHIAHETCSLNYSNHRDQFRADTHSWPYVHYSMHVHKRAVLITETLLYFRRLTKDLLSANLVQKPVFMLWLRPPCRFILLGYRVSKLTPICKKGEKIPQFCVTASCVRLLSVLFYFFKANELLKDLCFARGFCVTSMLLTHLFGFTLRGKIQFSRTVSKDGHRSIILNVLLGDFPASSIIHRLI